MAKPRIIVAAGGTGGHLFPAFALAQEMERRGYLTDLITDERARKYETGAPVRKLFTVPSATIASKNPLAVAKSIVQLTNGRKLSKNIMANTHPKVVVGFGGYPSVPPLLAATSLKIPTVIHEQNAVMGRANRMLAAKVSNIALTFENTKYVEDRYQNKVRVVGNPVRDEVLKLRHVDYEKPDEQFNLLVFGGSQGARYFSDVVPVALAMLPEALRKRLFVVQQCREEDVGRVRETYEQAGITATIEPFFDTLPEIMSKAHLVIARSGASTVSELAILGRPSILVPLPHALDNDQKQNARRLEQVGGAWVMEQNELTPELLSTGIANAMNDAEKLVESARDARILGRPRAVQHFADVVEKLAQYR